MSQLALYRAWRPQTFDEVVAQKQVVFPLKQAVISGDIGHAYLFAGTRGTGKTSMAKIFAKAVNCLHPEDGNPCNACAICQGINSGALLDVMEIDAASHNSVDNIRRLTDEVMFMPSEARYKVYIIDEVHMLSQGAFNALLKTLEEPPAHVIFILATTEVQRIPATILSRCQRFEFRRIPLEDIFQRLQAIAQADHIDITDEALMLMARLGDGALRDAISLLDQAQAGIKGQIGEAEVLNLAGLVQDEFLADFCQQVLNADLPATLALIEELQMSGRDLQRFLQDFLRYLRDILVVGLGGDSHKLLTESPEGLKRLQDLARLTTSQEIMAMLGRLSELNNDLRWSTDPRTSLELAFIGEIARRQAQATLRSEAKPSPRLEAQAGPRPEAQATPRPEAKPSPRPEAQAGPQPEAQAWVPAPVLAASDPDVFAGNPRVPGKREELTPAEKDVDAPAEKEPPSPAEPAVGEPGPEPPAPVNQQEPPAPADQEEPLAPKDQPEPPRPAEPAIREPGPEPPATVNQPEPSSTADHAGDEGAPAPISWNQVLDGLRARGRYDVILLIRPAQVSWEQNKLMIRYEQQHKAHAAALQRPENQEVLLDAVYELSQAKGLDRPKLQVELAGEAVSGDNLNPEEPVWVQKLRKASAQFQVPFDPADVKPPAVGGPAEPWSDQPFQQFSDR